MEHPAGGADREGLVSSVDDFLDLLEKVELEAKTSDTETYVEDPDEAKSGSLLPGDFRVLHRLGKGASSVGLLVEQHDQQYILKVAIDPDRNDRIKGEGEVLQKLRHSNIVEFIKPVEIGNRAGFLMRPVLVTVNDEHAWKRWPVDWEKRASCMSICCSGLVSACWMY